MFVFKDYNWSTKISPPEEEEYPRHEGEVVNVTGNGLKTLTFIVSGCGLQVVVVVGLSLLSSCRCCRVFSLFFAVKGVADCCVFYRRGRKDLKWF